MDEEASCRDVRQEILRVKDAPGKQVPMPFSRHLLECEACRSRFEAMERCERVLAAEKSRLRELAAPAESDKRRLLAKLTQPQVERSRGRRRLVWAGATAALLLAFFGVRTLINVGEEDVPRLRSTRPAITTHSAAEAAASETVWELAEVVSRFETPTAALPYTPPRLGGESPSFVPKLLQECVADSQDTMTAIVEAKTMLTRREET